MPKNKVKMVGGRRCTMCGEVYHRVNRLHVWTAMNPGHRMGWMLEEVRLCCTCFNAKKAQRIVTIATIAMVTDQRVAR